MRGGKEDMEWEINRKGREEGSDRDFFWGGGGGMHVWRCNIKENLHSLIPHLPPSILRWECGGAVKKTPNGVVIHNC